MTVERPCKTRSLPQESKKRGLHHNDKGPAQEQESTTYQTGYSADLPYPMSSMKTVPAPPAVVAFLSPIVIVIFSTLLKLTFAKSLIGIAHRVQSA